MSPVSRPIKFGILGFVGEVNQTAEKVSEQGQEPTTNSTPK